MDVNMEPSCAKTTIIARGSDDGITVYAVNGNGIGSEHEHVIYESGSTKTIVNIINSEQTIVPTHGPHHTLTLKIATAGESSWSNTSTDSACWDSFEDPDDVLPYTCKEFFEKRRESLDLWTTRQSNPVYHHPDDKESQLNRKLGVLRQEIASLVQQDDALFRQLLSLHASITALREATDEDEDEDSPSPSPWPSVSSLSLDDDERPSIVPVRPARRKQLLQNAQRSQDDENVRLTRQKISYPPKSRNRVLRYPSTFMRGNSPSQPPGSPTWSTASPTSSEDETNKLMVGGVTVTHRRQSSYDSGIQGSEPSDGEVFV